MKTKQRVEAVPAAKVAETACCYMRWQGGSRISWRWLRQRRLQRGKSSESLPSRSDAAGFDVRDGCMEEYWNGLCEHEKKYVKTKAVEHVYLMFALW